jgi:hypothetical protein
VTTTTWTIGRSEDVQLPIFYGQPIFLLWLIIHFIVSGKHYIGILTKKILAGLVWQFKSGNVTLTTTAGKRFAAMLAVATQTTGLAASLERRRHCN